MTTTSTPTAVEQVALLSPRQRQVMALIVRGRTNAEIGEALGMTLDGAKYHVTEILNKLGVDTREQAAEAWRASRRPSARARRWVRAAAALPVIAKASAGVGVVAVVGVAATVLVAGAISSGGDNPASAANSTATATSTATPTSPPWPGPAPTLGDAITAVFPAHGSSVSQTETRTTVPTQPQGVCFDADFTGLNGDARWFRLAVDGEEVTPRITWVVPGTQAPTTGRACLATPDGLAPGRHDAAVAVQDPNNPSAPSRQIVGWKFEVSAP